MASIVVCRKCNNLIGVFIERFPLSYEKLQWEKNEWFCFECIEAEHKRQEGKDKR